MKLKAPKGRPSKAQVNGPGMKPFSEVSPERATYGIRGYHAPSGLEPGMNYPLTTSTQAVGLGFARPPLRG
jgi:hypothetical protein